MSRLTPKQEYILDFMRTGKTAVVWGNRIQISGIDRGSASTMKALERKGLVRELKQEHPPPYSKMKMYVTAIEN